MISKLGLLYVDALKEKDRRKRLLLKAKIEERERTIRKQFVMKSFAEEVVEIDQKYKDRVFWMVENSNLSYDEVKNLTLEERVSLEYRINRKIDDENRRNRAGHSQL